VLFTACIAIITSVIVALPSLRVMHLDVNRSLKQGSVTSTPFGRRSGSFLIAGQITLCVVVLTVAGLFLRSLRNAFSIDLGFNSENVFVSRVDPVAQGYSGERSVSFFQQLEKQVGQLPGVRSASVVAPLPLSIFSSRRDFTRPGTSRTLNADVYVVGAQYFQTMGIPVLQGRDFRDVPTTSPLAITISQGLAGTFFSGENPLGHILRCQMGDDKASYEVVGIVGNTKTKTVGEEVRPVVYEYMNQNPKELEGFAAFGGISLVIKTTRNMPTVAPAVRQQVERLDPSMPVFGVESMHEQVGKALLVARISAIFLSAFAFLALALAGVGLYGVVSYSVACRTREIAIRAALGAPRRRTLASLTLQTLRGVGTGLALGLALSVIVARLISSFLYGVHGIDPLTFLFVPPFLLLVALVAVLLPAWLAIRENPMKALRSE